MSKEISKDWREKLANHIRIVGNDLFVNADKLADQPDYMTDFSIVLNFNENELPTYSVMHEHVPIGREEDL